VSGEVNGPRAHPVKKTGQIGNEKRACIEWLARFRVVGHLEVRVKLSLA
jgi:hypothetical protein